MTDEPRPDEDIDRVVHDMMDVDAARGFRGRVLARLDERPRVVRGWLVPAAAAAMALVVVAVLLPRHREPAPSSPTLTASVRSVKRATPSVPPPVVRETAAAPLSPRRPRARAARPVSPVPVAAIAEQTVVIPALPAPEPIAVASIEPAPLTIRAVETPPLATVPPIDIAPLPPPSGRN